MLQPLLRGFLEDFLRNEEKHGNGYMPVRAGGGLPTGDFGVGAGPGVALHSLRSPNLKPSEGRGSMALWMTVVIAFTCIGGLASPVPTPSPKALKELIEELVNITQNQKAPLCNGSMVWSINLTTSMVPPDSPVFSSPQYCAARESLINITNCSVIQRTQRMLNALCPHKLSAKVSSEHVRDTKIKVTQFIKTLLQHSRNVFHYRSFNWSKKS
ncbi:interleukin-13 precursor [Camelus ferus]|nr:interleukin-13 precursor [Camelus ferus]